MAMTVRFPTGLSLQYNDALYSVRRANGSTSLYTKEGGIWIAQVPTSGCVIEAQPACRVYNAISVDAALGPEVRAMAKEIAGLKRAIAKMSKRP
jgi:hypothetical protein